jgi:hypothetical protein
LEGCEGEKLWEMELEVAGDEGIPASHGCERTVENCAGTEFDKEYEESRGGRIGKRQRVRIYGKWSNREV